MYFGLTTRNQIWGWLQLLTIAYIILVYKKLDEDDKDRKVCRFCIIVLFFGSALLESFDKNTDGFFGMFGSMVRYMREGKPKSMGGNSSFLSQKHHNVPSLCLFRYILLVT